MPDLNSVPPSPRHLFPDPAPRSGILDMPPPPLPSSSSSSSNLLPSSTPRAAASRRSVDTTRQGSRHTSRGAPSPTAPVAAMTGQSPSREHNDRADYFTLRGTAAQGNRHGPNPVRSRDNSTSAGPGPSRHPRPMTAAELHSELEQEQEAMVNFLSRELQSLRDAHNSSVISNTSSTSTGLSVSGSEAANTPASARRPSLNHRRTSSNASSANLPVPARPVPSIHTMASSGISSPVPTRNPPQPYTASTSSSTTCTTTANPPYTMSTHEPEQIRAIPPYIQGRYTGPSPTLIGGAPAPLSSPGGPYSLSRSDSISRLSQSSASTTHQPRFSSSMAASPALSPALLPATSRFEETASNRLQYEAAKRENEALKQQIRELERRIRQRRASNGVPEEEVRVGESAASAGVQGEREGEACN